MKNQIITEYQIIFKEGDDFYTEDEAEYEAMFQEIVNNGDLDLVQQCVRKDYIFNEELNSWIEDWVEILY